MGARQRSDSEEAAAKFQIQVEEPISGAEEESDAEESVRSVDSADASSLVADATRARTDTLTVADAYDRIEDDDESDEEEHEEAIDEDSQSQKKASIMDLIDDDEQEESNEDSTSKVSVPASDAEDSTSSKMEGAEETEVEPSDDSQPRSAAESPVESPRSDTEIEEDLSDVEEEPVKEPEEEQCKEGKTEKDAPEFTQKSSPLLRIDTMESMGTVSDSWSPDIPKRASLKEKLNRLQSDDYGEL